MARQSTSRAPSAVYVVFGGERLLSDEAVRVVRREVLGPDPDPLACSEFDSTADLAVVLDELRTLPLLGNHRLVVIADADEFVSRHRDALQKYCGQPATTASLLLICRTFDRRTRLYRAVAEKGRLVPCEPLKSYKIGEWIVQQARKVYQRTVDERTAGFLQHLVGDDLSTLDQELSKLSTYVGDRTRITVEDVRALIGLHRQEKIFGVGDAILRSDGARALSLWEQVWNTDRAAPGRALGGLAWALRRNLEGKELLESGGSGGQLTRLFWRDAAEVKGMLKRVPREELERHVLDLGDADLAIKSGRLGPRQALEQLIVRCAARPPSTHGPTAEARKRKVERRPSR